LNKKFVNLLKKNIQGPSTKDNDNTTNTNANNLSNNG